MSHNSLLEEARRELARLPMVLEALLAGLDEEGARMRPAAGEWSPVEILCHLKNPVYSRDYPPCTKC